MDQDTELISEDLKIGGILLNLHLVIGIKSLINYRKRFIIPFEAAIG